MTLDVVWQDFLGSAATQFPEIITIVSVSISVLCNALFLIAIVYAFAAMTLVVFPQSLVKVLDRPDVIFLTCATIFHWLTGTIDIHQPCTPLSPRPEYAIAEAPKFMPRCECVRRAKLKSENSPPY